MTNLHIQTLGEGKPLILLHGWAMHSGVLGDFAVELAKHYKLTLIDLPGHGLSKPIRPFTLETIAVQLAQAMPNKPCHWLGWSLGAQVALRMAAAYPERVDKLILLAGTPCFVAKDGWSGMSEKVLDSFAEMLALDGEETLIRFLSLQVKDIDHAKAILAKLKSALRSAKFPDQQTLQDGLNILKTADLRSVMASLSQPTCAILGTHDSLVSVKAGIAMQQLLPPMQLHLVERAGHTPFLSHPAQTIGLIQQFLDS